MTTPTATLLPERVAALDTLTLARWSPGRKAGQTMGVMESAAWVAGEPHSDTPACVSPVLGAFLRELNEELDDEERQALKPYVTRIVGTGGDGHDKARAYLALDWLVRVNSPALLDLAGLTAEAESLRALPRIVDSETAGAAHLVAVIASAKAGIALDTTPRPPRDSNIGPDPRQELIPVTTRMYVASEAARSTAVGVTPVVREVIFSATTAARCAVNRVLRLTPRDAGTDPFGPTVTALQASIMDLIDRMVDPAAV